MPCKFVKAWIGHCGEPTEGETAFCSIHAGLKCCSCGGQATHECDQTGIQFVCCSPLCDDCTHGRPDPANPGMFMLGGGHHPKAAAVR